MTENTKGSTGKRLGIATLGAVVLLVMVVLPAEYGIDPTGFGRLTGISKLSDPAPTSTRDFRHLLHQHHNLVFGPDE